MIQVSERGSYVHTFVLVDSLMRTGHKLAMKLLSSLERCEQGNFSTVADSIHALTHLGLMDQSVATNLLRCEFDMALYYNLIGRNLNFRYFDDTGIWRSKDANEFFDRIFSKREADVLEQLVNKEISPIFTLMTHDLMTHPNVFFEAYPDMVVLHGRRNPLDVVYSWHQRNWGDRVGTDPRSLYLAFESNGVGPVPWYAAEWAERYVSLSPIDRVIYSVSDLLKREKSAKKELTEKQKNQIIPITYEWMVANTDEFLDLLCDKLNTKRTRMTGHRMLDENVPSVQSKSDYQRRHSLIKKEASEEAYDHLLEMTRVYEHESMEAYGLDVHALRIKGD